MDVNKDDFFEELAQEGAPMVEDNPIKLPLPDEDFDEFGKVKKMRKRVIKKLLRQEWKFYLPIMSLLSALVLVASIIFSVLLRFLIAKPEAFNNGFFPFFFLGWTIVFIYGIVGISIFSTIYPVVRYNKNFFKSEGYLTFSIPASMEEHLYAKRVAAIVCGLVSILVTVVSLGILVLVLGVLPEVGETIAIVFESLGNAFLVEPVHAVLFTVEILLSLFVSLVMSPCIYGAASCFLSKTTGKKKLGVSILLVFLAVGVVQSVVSGISQTIMIPLFMIGEVGLHIAIWIGIVVNVAVTIGCIIFELHFLKKKLDLK